MTRDLIGRAGRDPDMAWPNGARLAVSVVLDFEEGAERQVGDGDAASERIGEVLSVVAPGTRDIGQEQIFAYGMRAGLWRMLDPLDRHRSRGGARARHRHLSRPPLRAAWLARRRDGGAPPGLCIRLVPSDSEDIVAQIKVARGFSPFDALPNEEPPQLTALAEATSPGAKTRSGASSRQRASVRALPIAAIRPSSTRSVAGGAIVSASGRCQANDAALEQRLSPAGDAEPRRDAITR